MLSAGARLVFLSRERPGQQRFRFGALPIGRIHERHGIEKVRRVRGGFEGATRHRAHGRQRPIEIAPLRVGADQLRHAQQRALVPRVDRQRHLVRGYRTTGSFGASARPRSMASQNFAVW